MVKLKTCPLCGGNARPSQGKGSWDVLDTRPRPPLHWIACNVCGSKSGERASAKDAAELWNSRFLSSLPVRSGEVERLRTLLVTLEDAESFYRAQHDQYGDGSAKAGRAWDLMRRAGDNARAALAPPPQAQEVDHG